MGISWKTMPLLSTLAALVIIVHSAEEDFEPDYRDVRPRRFDTATTNYEQPWRILDMEPVATQTTQADWPVSSQEEPPKRRRPGRKRKRRPPPSSEEDLIPQERQVYHEEYRPYQHEKLNPQSGIIRRRRKQFDVRQSERPNSWADDTVDAERPLLRKRGHKRKRPLVEDTTPQLSEFNGYRPIDNTREDFDIPYILPTESTTYEANHNYDNGEEVNLQIGDTVIKSDSNERNANKYNNYEAHNYNNEYSAADTDYNSNHKKDDNKSLSEFSLEIQPPTDDDIISIHEKLSEKAVSALNDIEKAKSNETLDPQTLKQILKKSNGRSLSEILQQHNVSLIDLLHGKEKAISILVEDSPRNDSEFIKDQLNSKDENNTVSTENVRGTKENKRFHHRIVEPRPKASVRNTVIIKNVAEELSETNNEKSDIPGSILEQMTTKPSRHREAEIPNDNEKTHEQLSNIPQNVEITETTTKSSLRRRFPVGVRRKLRMRPLNNTTYKSQLSRDLITLTSRRYQLNRNTSRSREWQDVMPTQVKIIRKDEPKPNNEKDLTNQIATTTFIPEEITPQQSFEDAKISTLPPVTESDQSTTNDETDNPDYTSTESTQTIRMIDITVIENIPTTTITTTSTASTTTTTTERSVEKSVSRPLVKASDLRRQAFNNRLKRKRLKQKTTTTEPSQEYAMKDIFGMANLVSASEFIAKVQPRTTSSDDDQDFTNLEDFITTEMPIKSQTRLKSAKIPKNKYSTTHATLPAQDTEETAKVEIEEILNDTRTSARLSKILMERNMTINELVEHRERGSSHIHLADIFHNASKEPNPPEPFLSKSLIEPISKKTYPLRALLEANLHDPTAKATLIEPNSTFLNINIPVVLDFGNNVNENGENMGIMSLFDNFTKVTKMDTDLNALRGQTIEISSQTPQDDGHKKYGAPRESRTLNTDKDLVTWKEIIAIMHRGQKNNTHEVEELTKKGTSPAQQILNKIPLDDLDSEDDSLILAKDLHRLNDFNSQIASKSEENHEHDLREKIEPPQIHGVLNKTSDSAKSVTVATASIIGLAMVLFLLTYVAFRWKQQRTLFREKQTLRRDRIPTPVFENRKNQKINTSTRSKSPMISSSNIYSIDTLDTRNGNDSPEYMWDSLRKPFQ